MTLSQEGHKKPCVSHPSFLQQLCSSTSSYGPGSAIPQPSWPLTPAGSQGSGVSQRLRHAPHSERSLCVCVQREGSLALCGERSWRTQDRTGCIQGPKRGEARSCDRVQSLLTPKMWWAATATSFQRALKQAQDSGCCSYLGLPSMCLGTHTHRRLNVNPDHTDTLYLFQHAGRGSKSWHWAPSHCVGGCGRPV